MDFSFLKSKQILVALIFWFFFSFLVLWLMGGGCLGLMDGSSCISSGAFSFLGEIPIINYLFPFGEWSSLMYFFAPLAGFVLSFVFINWWNQFFGTKSASGLLFLVFLLVVLFLGYYINLFFYVSESTTIYTNRYDGQVVFSPYFCLSEVSASECNQHVSKLNEEFVSQFESGKSASVTQFVPISFWSEIRRSMYFLFILGAINAWLFCFGLEVFEKLKSD